MNEDFKPTIKVTVFKTSGKFYAEAENFLTPEHYAMHGFQLAELIENDDPSVELYSPLVGGFVSNSMIFHVEVDYGSKSNFCMFLKVPK